MVVRSHMKHIRLKPTECQPQLLDEWMMIDIGPELFLCCWKMTRTDHVEQVSSYLLE